MKYISRLSFLLALVVTIFWSCKKDENKIYAEGGTAPVLSASAGSVIPLSFLSKDEVAVKLNWSNPAYQFTTGLSSQDVSYLLEIDTTGAGFTNPLRQSIAISRELNISFSQGQLNDYLLNQLVLKPGISHNIEMRVKSYLGNNAVPLFSNVLKFTVTPYAIPPKVAPPASGKLFIIGNATPGGDATGWNNPVPVPAQEFTQVSPTLYRITVALIGGKSYLFLPVNGDWGLKYGAMGANGSNNPDGDDFKLQGGDLISPAAGGNYKIEVDFQRGKFTLTKL